MLKETLNKDLKQYLSQWAFRICEINGRNAFILNIINQNNLNCSMQGGRMKKHLSHIEIYLSTLNKTLESMCSQHQQSFSGFFFFSLMYETCLRYPCSLESYFSSGLHEFPPKRSFLPKYLPRKLHDQLRFYHELLFCLIFLNKAGQFRQFIFSLSISISTSIYLFFSLFP